MSGLFLFLAMQSFLEEVVEEVWKKYPVLEDLIFVLPSKRAGSFLKHGFARTAECTLFSPTIYSIETFVEAISGLSYASNTQLLFELYHTYVNHGQGEKDSFYNFSGWGQVLLQDFNEVDRYLVPPEKIFTYLSEIQEINHWYLKADRTRMIQDYIQFWNTLEQLYEKFNARLLATNTGYQGLVYRTACQKLSSYLKSTKAKKHIFIGFNALNTAESQIIQEILATSEADIFWDLDRCFEEDPIHDAGYFIRQHKRKWPYFQQHPMKGLSNHFHSDKMIRIVGVPKSVSQVKYAGHLLKQLYVERPETLKSTAVVLGDEALLNPLLNALPEEIEMVNITMGYPLSKTTLAGMFAEFFELYLHPDPRGWFYKNIVSLLSNNHIQSILSSEDPHNHIRFLDEIKTKNWVYITTENIIAHGGSNPNPLLQLFFDQKLSPSEFLDKCLQLTATLKSNFERNSNGLDLEYLYHFYKLFGQLKTMLGKYPYVADIKSLYRLYLELLSSETVNFQGEPMDGLQVMGMLESRNLDFETVIITSVNEGILPSGKSNNSFIPFDVKRDFDLPTYKEKDAVYTYHFYRLLQRAKNVFILYNTEPDVLEGGEKSRFISQLLLTTDDLKDIKHTIAAPKIYPESGVPQRIAKDQQLLDTLRTVISHGLSPTSLTNYIRNPIAFYKKAVLNIEEAIEVEETVAAATFGTVVHDALEELYHPFIGSTLSSEKLKAIIPGIETVVKKHFTEKYSSGAHLTGKNLIALKVIGRYIERFIAMEIEDARDHNIKIIGLEEKLKVELHIPEIDVPVLLKGTIDRVDEKDGILRIIDYKTGTVKPSQVEVVDWDEIITDYEYSKAFQLLCYALMYTRKNPEKTLEAGIISFKNLGAGLLPFATKEKKGSRIKNKLITRETLSLFQEQLYKLINEICRQDIPFTEKAV